MEFNFIYYWRILFNGIPHWFPMIISGAMSNIVNYVGHKPNWWGGYRRYNTRDDSINNWLWAIPSWEKHYTTIIIKDLIHTALW